MKLIVMAFDGGEKFSLHRAPGDAMLVSLEGESNIVYEGTAHILKAGDMIYFEKRGPSFCGSEGRMKMALLLMGK